MSPLERVRYLRRLRMPAHSKLVLYTVTSHANPLGSCWLLQSTLAEETGLGVRTIGRAVHFLNKHGLLIHVRHGYKASTFHLTLEAFDLARQRSATVAEYNRPYWPIEVTTPMKRKTVARPPKERMCKCGAILGDGYACIMCHKHRESVPGIRRVLPAHHNPTLGA